MSSTGGHHPVAELEQALGLSFQDRGLLIQALTHRSYVNETGGSDTDSYERLEFLGDVVVRLIVSEELFNRLPDCDEGGLTRRWTALLSQRALAIAARDLGLAEYVLLGRGFEASGGRYGDAVLGDVMESVIAAVYRDQGYERTRQFVLSALAKPLGAASQPEWRPDNPKAELQELLQGQGKPTPVYCVVASSGPSHQPNFEVEVATGEQVLGTGAGPSKSAAEVSAARAALAALTPG